MKLLNLLIAQALASSSCTSKLDQQSIIPVSAISTALDNKPISPEFVPEIDQKLLAETIGIIGSKLVWDIPEKDELIVIKKMTKALLSMKV
jgi:hypothetical protein